MAAMLGAPLAAVPLQPIDEPVPAMPCATELAGTKHRDKIPHVAYPFSACVARPVDRAERKEKPAAQAAIDKEWARLRALRGGKGCWDESAVREWRDVALSSRKSGIHVHVGRIFDICVEKGSELDPFLPDGSPNPDKKFKGRAVFQGNHVRDENFEAAMFAELSSCPATMEASKCADFFGLLPPHAVEQADSEQAYTQSELGGAKT